MPRIGLVDRVLCLSVVRTRRIRVWAAVAMVCFVFMAIQAAVPAWRILPDSTVRLDASAALAVFLAALFCEFIDSSLGMGYGTTLTPLLLLAGCEPLKIVPCVLLSELVTGIGASLMHHRDGNVDFLRDRQARSAALMLSVLSTVGAVAAVCLAIRVSKTWLSSIIAAIVLSVGVVTLATARRRIRYRPGHMIALGAVAAFNKGLSGGGYGPLVTAGQVVSGLPAKHAVAITSLAEAFTCAVGLAVYLLARGTIDWSLAIPLTLGASLSVPIATLTVRSLPEGLMRASVGVLACLLGLVTFAKILL